MLQENMRREAEGLSQISKLFIPFATDGWVGHGFLAVVEIGPAKNVHISIIDSFGAKSGYRSYEDDLADAIKQALPVDYRTADEVVYNNVIQQTDGRSCGFQQIRNLAALQDVDNVYEHVQMDGLSKGGRSLEGMEQWFEEEVKPQIINFLKD